MNVHGLESLTPQTLLLIAPLVIVQIGLMLLAIFDLLREDRAVRGGNKGVWAVVIVFVSLLGPILYFLVGRSDDPVEPAQPGPGAMPGWGSPHDPPIVAPPAGADAVAVAPRAPSPPPAAPSAIEIDHLTKRFPGGILALDGLTMTVPAGSVFGLLGPNGAGKTTTLRLLAGLARPTAGHARLAGAEVSSDDVDARRGLGYLEQDPRAYAWMTGREQLRLLGRLHGLRGIPGVRRRGRAGSRRPGGRGGPPGRLVLGGMRQRLGIAGALVHRPRVAILDEPVSSLDPEGRRDVLNLIAALRGETTVLFSTHVLADVERICDRVGILATGASWSRAPWRTCSIATPSPCTASRPNPASVTPSSALAATLRGLGWVTGVGVDHGVATVAVSDPDRAGREILPAMAASGVAVVSVARARPTLEDVFLRLTEDDAPGAAA